MGLFVERVSDLRILDYFCPQEITQKKEYIEEWLFVHRENYSQLYFLAVKKDKSLIALAPFVKHEKRFLFFKIKYIKFACWNLALYKDFLTKESDLKGVITAIFNFLSKQKDWDILELNQLRDESLSVKILKELKFKAFLKFFEVESKSVYLKIDKSFLEYFKSLNKSLKKNIKWISSRNFAFERVLTQEALEKFFEFHQRRWKDSKYKKKKHRNFLSSLLKKKFLDIFCLKDKDRIIATAICYNHRDILYYAHPAFDESYKKFSVGKFLLFCIIKHAFSLYKEIDLLVGEDRYKFHWADKIRLNYRFYFFKKTPKNIFLFLWRKYIRKVLVKIKTSVFC